MQKEKQEKKQDAEKEGTKGRENEPDRNNTIMKMKQTQEIVLTEMKIHKEKHSNTGNFNTYTSRKRTNAKQRRRTNKKGKENN